MEIGKGGSMQGRGCRLRWRNEWPYTAGSTCETLTVSTREREGHWRRLVESSPPNFITTAIRDCFDGAVRLETDCRRLADRS
jgi:hypothetical protein